MNSTPDRAKKCIECSNNISVLAIKCSYCSAYQDWRRYIPFGESTLAVVLSLIALTAVLLPDPRAPLKDINDYLSGTKFAMRATLVDMNIDHASVLVENRENSPAAMNHFSCLLNLPLDPHARTLESLRSRRDGTDDDFNRTLTVSKTMGVFQIVFELKNPVLVRPYEAAVITLSTAHISPPLRPAQARSPRETVTNFCLLSGANLKDEFAVGGIIINPNG